MVARAMVNRLWAVLLGRGIVHPVDAMDSQHDPSHPELLDWLAADFRNSDYNIRRLIRMIVLSEPYQLDSRRPPGVEDPAHFAWYIERPLTAEQLARSIQLILRGRFDNGAPLVRQLRKPLPEVLPESNTTKVSSALFLTNNPALNEFIASSTEADHLLARIRSADSVDSQIAQVVETVFGRAATAEEQQQIREFLSDDEAARTRRWQHVLWALLTSAEFRFNH